MQHLALNLSKTIELADDSRKVAYQFVLDTIIDHYIGEEKKQIIEAYSFALGIGDPTFHWCKELEQDLQKEAEDYYEKLTKKP